MTINLTNSNDTQINTFNPNFNQNIESVCINIDTVVHTEYEAILANSPNENITHDQQITEGYILNTIYDVLSNYRTNINGFSHDEMNFCRNNGISLDNNPANIRLNILKKMTEIEGTDLSSIDKIFYKLSSKNFNTSPEVNSNHKNETTNNLMSYVINYFYNIKNIFKNTWQHFMNQISKTERWEIKFLLEKINLDPNLSLENQPIIKAVKLLKECRGNKYLEKRLLNIFHNCKDLNELMSICNFYEKNKESIYNAINKREILSGEKRIPFLKFVLYSMPFEESSRKKLLDITDYKIKILTNITEKINFIDSDIIINSDKHFSLLGLYLLDNNKYLTLEDTNDIVSVVRLIHNDDIDTLIYQHKEVPYNKADVLIKSPSILKYISHPFYSKLESKWGKRINNEFGLEDFTDIITFFTQSPNIIDNLFYILESDKNLKITNLYLLNKKFNEMKEQTAFLIGTMNLPKKYIANFLAFFQNNKDYFERLKSRDLINIDFSKTNTYEETLTAIKCLATLSDDDYDKLSKDPKAIMDKVNEILINNTEPLCNNGTILSFQSKTTDIDNLILNFLRPNNNLTDRDELCYLLKAIYKISNIDDISIRTNLLKCIENCNKCGLIRINKFISLLSDDTELKKYSKEVNTINFDIFLVIREFKNKELRSALYNIALKIDNERSRSEMYEVIHFLRNGGKILLKDKASYEFLGGINRYNFTLYLKVNQFKNNEKLRITLYDIISTIDNEDKARKAFKSLDYLKWYRNWSALRLLKDTNSYFYLCDINEYNLKLYSLITMFPYKDAHSALYEIASHVTTKEEAKKVLRSFKFLQRNLVLLSNESSYYYLDKINKYNLSLYLELATANFVSEKEREAGFDIASSVTNSIEKKAAIELFKKYRDKKIPLSNFNGQLLKITPSPSFARIMGEENNTKSSQGEVLYKSLFEDEFIYENEIDIESSSTYEDIPQGMLCYQGDNLYIKKGDYLSKLSLSKGTFDRLFPDKSILNFSQNKRMGNCYLLSSIYLLLNNIDGRERILNCFSTDKNGNLLITFPNYAPITFKNFSPALKSERGIEACLGWRLFEEAYSTYKSGVLQKQNSPIDAEELIKSIDKLQGGSLYDVFDLLGFYNIDSFYNKKMYSEILSNEPFSELIEAFIQENKDKNLIIYLGSHKEVSQMMKNEGIYENHAYSVIKIEKGKFYIVNPYNTAGYIIIDRNTLNNCFSHINFCIPSQTIPLATIDNEDNYDENARKWWITKINEKYLREFDASKDINDRKRIFERRLSQLSKILEFEHLFLTKNAFDSSTLDPDFILSDDILFECLYKINIHNINLFARIAKIEDDTSKRAACNIASHIICEEDKKLSEVLSFLLSKGSELLKDEYFFYYSSINKNNYKQFVMASKISDPQKRKILYEEIANKR